MFYYLRSKNAFISVDHRWKLLLRSQLTVFRKMQKENLRVKTETEELHKEMKPGKLEKIISGNYIAYSIVAKKF